MQITFHEIWFYLSSFAVAFGIVSALGLVFLLLLNFIPFFHDQGLSIRFGIAWAFAHFAIVAFFSVLMFSSREPESDAWLMFWIPDYPMSLLLQYFDFGPLFIFGILGSAQYGFLGFLLGKLVSKFIR